MDNDGSIRASAARWPIFAAGAVITVTALAAYANSFGVPFIYDDVSSIVNNPTIRHLWPLGPVLSPPGKGATVSGRPLLNLSFAINYASGGLRVRDYHVTNLLIHILAGLTLFGIARRTLAGFLGEARSLGPGANVGGEPGHAADHRPTFLGFAIALLWTVHPLQTEAVTYAVQRAESLMGLFYLLTLYFFIRGIDADDQGSRFAWFSSSITACLLGMASKEVMVSAPVMVLLYDRTFVAGSFQEAWRRRWRLYLGLAATWCLLAFLVISGGGNRNGSAGFDVGIAWSAYWFTQFRAIVQYVCLAIWPHPLILDYGIFWEKDAVQVVFFACLVALLVGATATALWRWPAWGFLGAWFFTILAPTSLVPGTTQMIVEHRMYLALASVITAFVCGIYGLMERMRRDSRLGGRPAAFLPRSLAVVLAVAAVGLCTLTARRNADYRSVLSIWSDTVAKRPDNGRAHNGMATALAQIPGRLPEALAHFEMALRIDPNDAVAHYNLASELAKIPGRLPEALEHFETALRIQPNYEEAHNNLANELTKIPGRLPEALAHYEQALRIDPNDAEAHYNLATELAKIPGRLPEALAHFETALRINPNYEEAHNNLANLLAKIPGRLPEALTHFETALRIDPNNAEAHNNLANELARIPGRLPEALTHYEAALRISPDYAEAHYNLANTLAKIPSRQTEALAHYEAALRIEPDFTAAEERLAAELAKIPSRQPEALAHYEAVLRIEPNDAAAHNNLGVLLEKVPDRLPEALEHFETALRIQPDNAEAHNNIAVIYAMNGRLDEAIVQLELALKLDPADGEARVNLEKLRAAQR